MFVTSLIPMNLRYFGEEQADITPEGVQPEADNTQRESAQEPNESVKPEVKTNYEELYATDKGFQRFVDKTVTKATQTAVENAIKKQQRLADEKLSEGEKLQQMNDREKAAYFEKKFKDMERLQARQKEIDGLKAQTAAMLTENAIPDMFLETFNFADASSADIKSRVDMLAEYEYYPKGTFKKSVDDAVTAQLNAKLKQTAPAAVDNTAAKPPPIPILF